MAEVQGLYAAVAMLGPTVKAPIADTADFVRSLKQHPGSQQVGGRDDTTQLPQHVSAAIGAMNVPPSSEFVISALVADFLATKADMSGSNVPLYWQGSGSLQLQNLLPANALDVNTKRPGATVPVTFNSDCIAERAAIAGLTRLYMAEPAVSHVAVSATQKRVKEISISQQPSLGSAAYSKAARSQADYVPQRRVSVAGNDGHKLLRIRDYFATDPLTIYNSFVPEMKQNIDSIIINGIVHWERS